MHTKSGGSRTTSRFAALAVVLTLLAGTEALAASVTYEYNNKGQLVGATFADGRTVTYTYDDNGNRLAAIVGQAADTTPPTVPSSFTATASSSSQITLTWNASTDSGGSGLAGYKLEACAGSSCSNYAQIAVLTTTSFPHTGLPPNATYRYRIRAYDNAGNHSAYSSVKSATTAPDTTAPTTPGNFTATAASTSKINLKWDASADSGGSGLAGYKIERCTGSSCTNFAQIATTTSTSYGSTGLADATTYRYRVRAYDGAGNNSSYSTIRSATTADGTAPSAPGTVSFSSITYTSAKATWGAASDNVGVTAYEYRLGTSGSFTNVGNVLTVNLSGLTAATTYTFQVRARDAAGNVSSVRSGTFTTSIPAITLPSVYSFNVSGAGGSTATFWVTSGGDLKHSQSNTSTQLDFGDWLSPKQGMSKFEVYATGSCNGSPKNTWLNLGTTVSWYVSVTGVRGATASCSMNLQIRRVGTTTVLGSGTIAAVAVGT